MVALVVKHIRAVAVISTATIVLVSSCSSRFEVGERRIMQWNFLSEGEDVLVVTTPTDEDYEKAQKDAQRDLEIKCATNRRSITIEEDPLPEPTQISCG